MEIFDNCIGVDIDDSFLDSKIYRIFSEKWFMELLETKKNGLVNHSKWDDPYDKFLFGFCVVDENEQPISTENLSKAWFGQCWTRNKDSDAMWRIYSSEKKGIRVATTVRKLFENFYKEFEKYDGNHPSISCFIGQVEYLERVKIEEFLKHNTFMSLAFGGDNKKFAKLLCIKRMEFEHENEVRLIFNIVNSDVSKLSNTEIVHYNFDLSIISEVAIDPRLEYDKFQDLKKKIEEIGCLAPIIQSDLYKIDKITIPFV